MKNAQNSPSPISMTISKNLGTFPLLTLVFVLTPISTGAFALSAAHPTTQVASSMPAASTTQQEDAAELKSAFESAVTPLDRGRAGLDLARRLIVRESAPILSRELHRPGSGGEELVRRATEGLDWLEKTALALEEAKGSEDAESREILENDIELLRTFGKVFAALGEGSDTEEERERLIDVCGDLALYIDDSDHAIGESAKLWQAAAYRRAGRAERALQILRPVLAPPADARIGFLARVERCRALLDEGHYATAIALVHRLKFRQDAWFDDEKESAGRQAAETLKRMQVDLLRAWEKSLRKKNEDEQADEIAREWKSLARDDEQPEASDRLLPLERTIATTPSALQEAPVEKSRAERG